MRLFNRISKIVFLFGIVGVATLFLPRVDAATLGFAPTAGTYNVGQTFSLAIKVNSQGTAINAVSGTISFPQDKLSAVSISKTGSIVNLWVREPSFSNSTGSISFEGVALNPGFNGSAGTVITVSFRALAAGTARVSFSEGVVLANDGAGTSVLKSLGGASFNLGAAPPSGTVPIAPAATPPETPSAAIPETPTITNYPSQLQTGDTLVIEGKTDPNSRVALWLQQPGAEARKTVAIITSDQRGNFIFIYQKQLEGGIYEFWAEALDEKNVMSLPTAKLTVEVEEPAPAGGTVCATEYLTIILSLVALIVLLLAIVWYGWHKLFLLGIHLREGKIQSGPDFPGSVR